MFSREEAYKLKEQFWTKFGKRMKKHVSAESGQGINWVNYKTFVNNINFRMEANNKFASIEIEITHRDETMRAIFYEQLTEMKNYLHNILREEWIWEEHAFNEQGHAISRVYTQIDGHNVFVNDNWNRLAQFFELRLVRLDEFWADAKETFIELEN